MKERSEILRKKAFERDNFTCQKCKVRDKTSRILEAHHINLLCDKGVDELDKNHIITTIKTNNKSRKRAREDITALEKNIFSKETKIRLNEISKLIDKKYLLNVT